MAGLGADIAAVKIPFQFVFGFCVYIFRDDPADIVVSAESVSSTLLVKVRPSARFAVDVRVSQSAGPSDAADDALKLFRVSGRETACAGNDQRIHCRPPSKNSLTVCRGCVIIITERARSNLKSKPFTRNCYDPILSERR